ncbi:MAG TPA: molybdate ABC transporter substrate-binding protein, partial [Planctomycetota bacterium]
AQLADLRLRFVSIGDPASVPAGRYARAWLEARGLWSRLAARILPAVDARAAVAAVASGGAEAGIVYRTDAALSGSVRLVHEVPPAEGPRIVYPLVVLAGRPHEPAARAFAEFLASPAAGIAFEERGFLFLPSPTRQR